MKILNNQDEVDQTLKQEELLKINSFTVECPCTISSNESLFHNFYGWTFKEEVVFNGTFTKDINIEGTTFYKNVSFHNVKFDCKIRFYSSIFKSTVNFNNTKFEDLADFWNVTFEKKIIFYKTDFKGITVFAITKFKENVLFTYTLIKEVVIFRQTKFHKGLDLSLAIISGYCSFFDIRFYDFKDIKDIDDDEKYEDAVSALGVIPKKNRRETYRIIKNQLKAQSNNYDAVEYSNLEAKVFNSQVCFRVKENKILKKPIGNLIIMLLNRISNNHGKSWSLGIVFTILIGLFFFNFSLSFTKISSFSKNCNFIDTLDFYIKYFTEFMNPTHNIIYMDSYYPENLFYVFDFLGRIFVGFGIYQTIQAFRKYR